ncbi:lipid-A-disaccharide synthase [Xylanibacter ruminicola]|uniref:Lipid-A-disaccharide synthase n=1 Tax=Xylanibacter ruminicola TaxID=839 RepID=A0A1M6YHK5_XYLRU|nr:lipid-A-disaccharide synthase [Xylanibacter ruminicola]SHL17824.1 lipid-A-disaccharide synthase [Xylanibacter ruminicola]
MRYYLIVGEASGDLHASHLMHSLKEIDANAQFRFFGGDMMTAVGGTRVRHYKELAYMGFIPVLLHLPTILRNMKMCKQDIVAWQPDCVVLVDYPGFNLKIAEYVKSHTNIPVFYYISPKIWAWKEYRIKNIKRDVDELYSILPFEVDFFEKKHNYPIHYVGNPTADEVREFCGRGGAVVRGDDRIIALLAGSRKQEIKDNLPPMLEAVKGYENNYQIVVAGAPGIAPEYYQEFMKGSQAEIVFGKTYDLLSKAHAALVTSGTATLETCLFGVPQVVCYKTPLPQIAGFVRRHMLKVKYVSLVNLVAGREVVKELVAESFSVANIRTELAKILSGDAREEMLEGYLEVSRALGDEKAPDNAARMMYNLLNN